MIAFMLQKVFTFAAFQLPSSMELDPLEITMGSSPSLKDA